jgi:hypothetical protein
VLRKIGSPLMSGPSCQIPAQSLKQRPWPIELAVKVEVDAIVQSVHQLEFFVVARLATSDTAHELESLANCPVLTTLTSPVVAANLCRLNAP